MNRKHHEQTTESNKAMSREVANEFDKIYSQLSEVDRVIDSVKKEMEALKKEFGAIEEVAWGADKKIDEHKILCENDKSHGRESMKRIERAINKVADNLEKQTVATRKDITNTDQKISAQKEKWGSLKDKILFGTISVLGTGLVGTIIYIFLNKP